MDILLSSTKTTCNGQATYIIDVSLLSSKQGMPSVLNINAKMGLLDHVQLHLKYQFNIFQLNDYIFCLEGNKKDSLFLAGVNKDGS